MYSQQSHYSMAPAALKPSTAASANTTTTNDHYPRKSARTALGDISNRMNQIHQQPAVGGSKLLMNNAMNNNHHHHNNQGGAITKKRNQALEVSVINNNAANMSVEMKDDACSQQQQGMDHMINNNYQANNNHHQINNNNNNNHQAIGGECDGMETSLEDSVADLKLQQQEDSGALINGKNNNNNINNNTNANNALMNDYQDPFKSDPQYVSDYVDDIFPFLQSIETRYLASPSYMSRQSDINSRMREILVDWLVEVHLKFRLHQETLFLTINIIDRFLEKKLLSRHKLQLLGCTAMLIAAKYEEIFTPEINDFVKVSDNAYTREQILQMESLILNLLNFHLTVPSSYRFAQRYIQIVQRSYLQRFFEAKKQYLLGGNHRGVLLIEAEEKNSYREREIINHLTFYFVELVLQEYKYLQYPPSLIASAALLLALLNSKCSDYHYLQSFLSLPSSLSPAPAGQTTQESLVESLWEGLHYQTGYPFGALIAPLKDLFYSANNDTAKYRAVRKKYAHKRYNEVSTMKIILPNTWIQQNTGNNNSNNNNNNASNNTNNNNHNQQISN